MNPWYIIPASFIIAGGWFGTTGAGGLLIGSIPISIGIALHLLWLIYSEIRKIREQGEVQQNENQRRTNAFKENHGAKTIESKANA